MVTKEEVLGDFKSPDLVIQYHERTKHHYSRFAASPDYMDWETQPNPFRRFEGAPLMRLPIPKKDLTPPYDRIFRPGAVATRPVSLETVSQFFFYSLALSAWKQFGENRWSLRVNPSSGNLHPTEGYLAIYGMEGLHAGPAVYHYAPKEHGLERRREFQDDLWKRLSDGLPNGAFLVGLSSIHWRESWKYGERAFRYCQHDAGHALAALSISAALLGWELRVLSQVSDEDIGLLFGLGQDKSVQVQEREASDLIATVFPNRGSVKSEAIRADLPLEAIKTVAEGQWIGTPNSLSSDHVDWDAIGLVDEACKKFRGAALPVREFPVNPAAAANEAAEKNVSAGFVIRERRSAVAMDGKTYLERDAFYAMLARTLPRADSVPFDSVRWAGFVHLGIFVHRVRGLEPGLYCLVRNGTEGESLREAMNSNFTWRKAPGAPESLPLYLLKAEDVRNLATRVSCGQDIAGDSAFSLGMLAEFEPLSSCGPHFYRNLFWETGMIGQVLYLEAEAWGVRSTGIGCFFDDPVHEAFGIKGKSIQSLYHFTVGGAVPDKRLMTLPAYFHLEQGASPGESSGATMESDGNSEAPTSII